MFELMLCMSTLWLASIVHEHDRYDHVLISNMHGSCLFNHANVLQCDLCGVLPLVQPFMRPDTPFA
jgi:hypothetical protein